jgi:hypothetical protein
MAVRAHYFPSGGERLRADTWRSAPSRGAAVGTADLAIAARSAPLDFDPHRIVAVRRKG